MGTMIFSSVFIWSIYICNIVNGAASADCGDPVAEGDPQVLTCHITGSIVVGISWFREGNTSRIITCTSNTCISNNVSYNVSSTPHPNNTQQFTINSVSAEDFTKKWICVDGTNYSDPTRSNCTLTQFTTSTTASTSTTGGSPSSVINTGTSDSGSLQETTAAPDVPPVAAISGGIVAAVVVVTIVIVVIIIYKRRKAKDNLGNPSSSRHDMEMEDNHQSVGRDNPGLNNQHVEILPNRLYESSDMFCGPKPDVVPGKGVQGKKETGGIFGSRATAVPSPAEPVYGQVNKPEVNKGIKKKYNKTSKLSKPPPVPPKIEVQNNNNEDKNTGGATKKKPRKPNTVGLNYIDVDFSNQGPTGKIHGEQETTTYAGIAHGKKGKPPPPDSDSDDD